MQLAKWSRRGSSTCSGQSELTILVDPRVPSKIFQGITTEITGEGNSAAPLNDAIIAADQARTTTTTISILIGGHFGEYFARLEKQGMGINLASYVGATQVRRMVLGDDDVQPTPAQLEQMKALVRAGHAEMARWEFRRPWNMRQRPMPKPKNWSRWPAEAAKFGGIYATHMRNESDAVLAAIDEALRIGREAHIPVEIWHIKVAGKDNWGRMPEVVAKINAARAAGVDVSANTYAYTAWFNDFSAFIPPWAHDGGTAKLVERLKDPAMRARIRKDMLTPSRDWDNEWQEIPGPEAIMIGAVQNPEAAAAAGQAAVGDRQALEQRSHRRAVRLSDRGPRSTGVAVFGMSQPDVTLALQQPWVSIDNDSEGTSPEGILGEAASSSPGLRNVSAHPAQVRARRTKL